MNKTGPLPQARKQHAAALLLPNLYITCLEHPTQDELYLVLLMDGNANKVDSYVVQRNRLATDADLQLTLLRLYVEELEQRKYTDAKRRALWEEIRQTVTEWVTEAESTRADLRILHLDAAHAVRTVYLKAGCLPDDFNSVDPGRVVFRPVRRRSF